MKRLHSFLLVLCLLFSLTGFARRDKHLRFPYRDDTQGEGYFSLFGFAGYVAYKPMPGLFEAKFPYKLTDRYSGQVTNDTFYCSRSNFTGNGKFVYPGVGIEIGRGSTTIEASIGAYLKNWSDNIYVGLNYRFVLKGFPVRPHRFVFGATSFPGEKSMERFADFPVKFSIGWFYYQPIWNLGTIDVGSQEFSAIGYTMQSRDSIPAAGSGTVIVLYHQNILAITPSVTLGYRPLNGRADISLRIAPFITYKENGGLRFNLRNNGVVDWAPRNGISADAVIPLNTYGLDATFNGEQLRQTPFKFKCVMFTLRIGIRIV